MPEREIIKIFNENLKHYISEYGMTYAEFARKIGVSPSTVSMWRREINMPRMELLDKIADLFHIEVADLYRNRAKCNDNSQHHPSTIAAHFDGEEYTEEQLERIKEFAKFIKSQEDPK